ncbi:putative ribonuclease H-like domain-containing protein [Tanacetum coccineum]
MASDHVSSNPVPQSETVTTSNELDLLFSLMFNELLNGTTQVVSKSFAVSAADAHNQRQQQHTTPSTSITVTADTPPLSIQTTPETTSQTLTQVPTITATEKINKAETNKEKAHVEEDEFINILNKKDERCIVIRKKARLVAQGYIQEEGIDYDEMDVKNAFLYSKIEGEIYVCQPSGFEDPEFRNKVYKLEKELYGLHQAPRAWYDTLSTYLLDNGFQRDKYVEEILKKFGFSTVKTASTPMETSKPLLKNAEAEDVDVHLYRSMIGSLMYLTASRTDIMFAVCACARFKESPFDLESYTDSDYDGASLDRKSTIGGCQFLRKRLISWQCKKKTIVANSTTEAEYVAAAS